MIAAFPTATARQSVPLRCILIEAGILSLALLNACGGPTGPSEVYTVQAVVFYDQDSDGILDPEDSMRIPQVVVFCAGKTGTSVPVTGQAKIDGVPSGNQFLSVLQSSLPPFFEPRVGGVPVVVPSAGEVPIPVTLPIGGAVPHTYMAFGDSITEGDGSSDWRGYRRPLEELLEAYWGVNVSVINRGIGGQKTSLGAQRIASDLSLYDPAYTLILFGTNDFNDIECHRNFPCYTIDNLRTMIRAVRGYQSLPVIGTIPPAAPLWNPADRNDWAKQMNDLLKPMALAEGAVVADVYAAFPTGPELQNLFADHVHPNDEGHLLIAKAFYQAIVTPRSGASSAALFMKGFFWHSWPVGPLPTPVPFIDGYAP